MSLFKGNRKEHVSCACIIILSCITGGGVPAGAAGAAEAKCGAERHVVPEPVPGDGEPEEQAGHGDCPLPVPGNTSWGESVLWNFLELIISRFCKLW